MKEYLARPELTDLLTVLCKLGMGYTEDQAVIDLSLRKWFVFDNRNAEQVLMSEVNAFTTKTSLVLNMLCNKKSHSFEWL